MRDLPSCPQCKSDLHVRVEQVICGIRIENAYYCGKCNAEWRIDVRPLSKKLPRRPDTD